MQCRKHNWAILIMLLSFVSLVCSLPFDHSIIISSGKEFCWTKSRFGWPLVVAKKEIRNVISHTNCHPHRSHLMYLEGKIVKEKGNNLPNAEGPSFILEYPSLYKLSVSRSIWTSADSMLAIKMKKWFVYYCPSIQCCNSELNLIECGMAALFHSNWM